MAVLGSPASVESTGEGRGVASDEEHAPNTTQVAPTPRWRAFVSVHPAAEAFPLEADDPAGMVADIKTNGIITPIALRAVEGGWQVLDGRVRLTAAELAGIDLFTPDGKPIWRYFKTVGADSAFDPVAYVISANLKRRHLDESQRAIVAAKLANLKKGGAGGSTVMSDTAIAVSQPKAAKLLNVSVDSVQRAGTVLREGSPRLVEQVERGDISVSAAAKSIKAAKPQRSTQAAGDRVERERQADVSLVPIRKSDEHVTRAAVRREIRRFINRLGSLLTQVTLIPEPERRADLHEIAKLLGVDVAPRDGGE